MNRRRVDMLDAELTARARNWRAFDRCDERPHYEPLGAEGQRFNMSKTSLEMAAREIGPAFTYNLYVHPIKLLQARNLVWAIVAQVKSNPFAPHINIIECHPLDEGEWVFEANGKLVGSSLT